ncbi:transposase [Mesorhizobium sp. J18]|nr:transposase [Mesorhizobium sp. J18]
MIKDIRRATRRQYGAEEKICIVLEGLRGEESIAALCQHEGIAESLYYTWSKEFLEAVNRRPIDNEVGPSLVDLLYDVEGAVGWKPTGSNLIRLSTSSGSPVCLAIQSRTR